MSDRSAFATPLADKTLLVLGLGNLGSYALDMLIRRPAGPRLIVAGRDGEAVRKRANLSRLTAAQLGFHRTVGTAVIDLTDVTATARALAELRPDIVFTTASRQAWWVVDALPGPLREELSPAQFGPWLPMHLAPLLQLMQAVGASGIDTTVVNAAFPDATHAALAGADLAPLVGIGNVANPLPALRHAAADLLAEPVDNVSVRLVAAHYASTRLPRLGHSGGAPYAMSVLAGGKDVTASLDTAQVAARAAADHTRHGGPLGGMLTAASAITVLDGLLGEEERLVHAPGPLGLPGGYPLMASERGVTLALPEGMSEQTARRINEEGLAHDGIAGIEPDGTVRFADPHHQVMREVIGYDCPVLPLSDVLDRADELGRRFAELRRGLG
ncbi:hypothetical protein DMH02_026435 [Streptomyces sp. WAC 00631]|uniref:hypothetical protein n=1 Tax=unclassified Streptomyces TaxID=2593676 RepID=UPI000F77E56C|nr:MULTISPECIES: hypothetical protein [unclassified Streptomyces]MCC5036612.1 hypothetical protein [Streptomyces sp. WAC 00631]MCC9738243.1 hypothetical protein [Streptomyces sp. MNU89]